MITVDAGRVATATDVHIAQQRWVTALLARAGTRAIGAGLIVFPTPIGALALDSANGLLRWSWADEALAGPRRSPLTARQLAR